MKMLQTPIRFYPATGGVEKYALDLSQELARQGNKVEVICADEPKSDIKEYKGIKIKRLRSFLKIANTNITLSLPFRLLKEKYDLVHTYLPTPWSADWSAVIGKLRRKKVVVSYCNDIIGQGIGNTISKIYNATFLRITLSLADRIIIIGPDYLKTSPHLKRYASKVVYIPVGIDTNRFKKINIPKQKNSLFFLSILDEYHKYKGLDYLLDAIKIVKNKIPDIKLNIGGRGKLLDYYKNKVKQLSIEKNVEFLGFIPDNKLVEYYNKSEIFILPSIDKEQEGFGIVLVEALACGTPVITTKIAGMAKEIKDNNSGIVIEPRNSQLLAESIIKILSNKKYKEELITNTIKTAQQFSIKKITQKVVALYRQL